MLISYVFNCFGFRIPFIFTKFDTVKLNFDGNVLKMHGMPLYVCDGFRFYDVSALFPLPVSFHFECINWMDRMPYWSCQRARDTVMA